LASSHSYTGGFYAERRFLRFAVNRSILGPVKRKRQCQ
jgi:hypothetical protein